MWIVGLATAISGFLTRALSSNVSFMALLHRIRLCQLQDSNFPCAEPSPCCFGTLQVGFWKKWTFREP